MFQNFSGWHFLIILVVVLLLFGAPKLPKLARSLGQSLRIFKGEMKTMAKDDTSGQKDNSAEDAESSDVADRPEKQKLSS